MRVVAQRVASARVEVEGRVVGEIGPGLLVLVAFRAADTAAEMRWMAAKLADLRIFPDEEGRMNVSLREREGSFLVVSQFTLYGDTRKGRRPSFLDSAPGDVAHQLYDQFVDIVRGTGMVVQTGSFGAHMEVSLCNDGPVTLVLDRDAVVEG